MSTIYVDREEASQILKVSTRTIDRYIRRYRFKTRKNGRKVLIKKVDVDRIIQDQIGQFIDMGDKPLSDFLNEKTTHQESEKVTSLAIKDVKVEEIKDKDLAKVVTVYKELLAETKKELKDKQDRLEAATYRVGQLETQLKSMVPLLDYNRKDKELKEAQTAIEQKETHWKETVKKTEEKLRTEQVLKWVYLSIVGMLLVVEPILFLLWAFS